MILIFSYVTINKHTWSCRTEIKRSDSLKPYGILNPCGLKTHLNTSFTINKILLTQIFFFLVQVHEKSKDQIKVFPIQLLFLRQLYWKMPVHISVHLNMIVTNSFEDPLVVHLLILLIKFLILIQWKYPILTNTIL